MTTRGAHALRAIRHRGGKGVKGITCAMGALQLRRLSRKVRRADGGRTSGPRPLHTAAYCGVSLQGVRGALRRWASSSRVSLSSCPSHRRPGQAARGKHDGYRIIARKDGNRVTLWCRYSTNFTDRLPKIAEAVCSLAAESALIDGEAVAVRPDGHSDFAALRTKVGSARACFVAFDLLSLNGQDFRKRPIEERRAALSPLVAGVGNILVQRCPGGRGRARVRQSLRAGPGGDRLEARRQPIFERKQPAMAQVEEPSVCAAMNASAVAAAQTMCPFGRYESLAC